MQLPFFFSNEIGKVGDTLTLPEETSKHIISVLRMKVGQQVHLTDGKGTLMTATVTDDHKKRCIVEIVDAKFHPFNGKDITIAISILKNAHRFEWFLEKATEIGISSIVPIICERTEKQSFRFDRMQGVVESALLQSRQVWMPTLCEPTKFDYLVRNDLAAGIGYIAHCGDDEKPLLSRLPLNHLEQLRILIGPEGDFTEHEIEVAVTKGYIPVSLGNSRLRTETAGMVAAVILKQFSQSI